MGVTGISVMTADIFSGNALTESNRIGIGGGERRGAERVVPI
jgi:hypothetical protein